MSSTDLPHASVATPVVTTDDLAALETRIVAFVRAFGLLEPDTTPCGQPMTPSEAHALTDLADTGECNQKELCTSLGLEKSTVSRLVGKLEARGWVQRARDPTDGRAVLLSLTDAGRRAAGNVATARRERLGRLLAAIPSSDRDQVLSALEILGDAAHER